MFVAASDLPITITWTVSGPVLIAICGMVTAIVGLWKSIRDTKKQLSDRSAIGDVDTFRDLIEQSIKNTQPTSNGFATRVLSQLESIDRRTARTEDAVQNHLEWHMKQNRKEGN